MGKWEMVRLGEVANINMGQSPESSTYNQIGKGIPFYQGNADFGERYPVKRFWCTVPKKLSAKDDILISVRAPIGAMNFSIETCCIGRGLASITPNTKKLEQKYLWYILKSNYDFLNRQGTGSTFKAINKKILTELLIPLPPLDEQKRIAKNLDLASEIVKDYKDQLAELDKLVQSVFYEMFGDPVTNEKGWISQSLLDFGSCKNGMNFGAYEKGIEIKYLGVGHFKELSIIDGVDKLSTISLMQAPSKEYLLKDEDIIFVRSNGNKNLVGRCVVVYPGDAALTFSGFCIRFRKSSDKLMTIYLLYVLKCASVRRLLLGRGANIQNLNQQILKQLKVPVPPSSLQAQFVEIITEIENQKKQIQQALTEAENLLNSLMQKYFE